jgi:hypothetical protein
MQAILGDPRFEHTKSTCSTVGHTSRDIRRPTLGASWNGPTMPQSTRITNPGVVFLYSNVVAAVGAALVGQWVVAVLVSAPVLALHVTYLIFGRKVLAVASVVCIVAGIGAIIASLLVRIEWIRVIWLSASVVLLSGHLVGAYAWDEDHAKQQV